MDKQECQPKLTLLWNQSNQAEATMCYVLLGGEKNRQNTVKFLHEIN